MARFGTQLSSYSLLQLSELLEDDEKLSSIVLDLDEVRVCGVWFLRFALKLRKQSDR